METLIKEDVDLSPQPLYQIALGFAATKALLAAHRLGVFQSLGTSSKTAAQVAEACDLSMRGTEILLDSCVSLKLCEKKEGEYSNSALVQRFLLPGQRGYLGRFMDHFNDTMYPAWLHLEEAVRTGHAQIQKVVGNETDHFFQAIDKDKHQLQTFMETMEEHSLLEGAALAAAYDFSGHRKLLDVGGGTGAMSVSILEKYPHLEATVFDRPPVCEIAKTFVEEHGFTGRIQLQAGSFLTDPLPQGADVVLLSAILHNWPPQEAQTILEQCHRALLPGGTLLISDQVINDDKTGPLPALLCSLNMLVLLEGAQEYSRLELISFLSRTGFELREIRPTQGARQLLIATRR